MNASESSRTTRVRLALSDRPSATTALAAHRARPRLGEIVVLLLLLAAPLVAAALFWGSWGWVAIAAVVSVVEYVTLRRSQRFAARLWRSVPLGRRRSRERATETSYVVAALAGVALFVVALLIRF